MLPARMPGRRGRAGGRRTTSHRLLCSLRSEKAAAAAGAERTKQGIAFIHRSYAWPGSVHTEWNGPRELQ